jgi:hypothetical protein
MEISCVQGVLLCYKEAHNKTGKSARHDAPLTTENI